MAKINEHDIDMLEDMVSILKRNKYTITARELERIIEKIKEE